MCVHMWCHAVIHIKNPIFPVEIEIYMWPDMGISPHGIVCMMQDLAIEASYTIHENYYRHDK